MKQIALSFALVSIAASVLAENERVASKVYEWEDLEVERSDTRERRHILKGYSEGFEYLQIHTSTVEPGKAAHEPHTHADQEELILIKEGTIEQTINGASKVLAPGSVTLVMPRDEHGMRNVGDTPATYYIIRWRTKVPRGPAETTPKSEMANWTDLEFKQNFKGGRRHVMRRPTSMLAEFEMHVTTLKEGMKSHDPHTHIEAEIILVRKGRVEEMIDGIPHPAGPGSVIFLESNVPHGIRNIGEGPCEYYAFKWKLREG